MKNVFQPLIWMLALVSTGFNARSAQSPLSDPRFFPLAVWLQDPANAEHYRRAGINTYVGLWKGPTEDQLARLKKAGMHVICEQSETALRHIDDPTILGWMHGDEPDNAQSLGTDKGWGPPITPEQIKQDYRRIRAKDPTRPVLLNLGQGVAWDGWYGRGTRSNHPEDYPDYLSGCDIVSFDIYPVVHDHKDVVGKLWLVPYGVERLVRWSTNNQVVWNCLECTHIGNPNRKPTPQEVRCEAWMSLIRGSRGLIYFVHQFKPEFREAALLQDSEMLAAVTSINSQITDLAPVLKSPTFANVATVHCNNESVPVAFMVKKHENSIYLFATAMRPGTTSAEFRLDGVDKDAAVEVLGEDRKLPMHNGAFRDDFQTWAVHLYRIGL